MSSSISSLFIGIFAPNSTAQTSQVSGDSQASDASQQVAQNNQSSGYGPAVIIDISPQALAALNGTSGGGTTQGRDYNILRPILRFGTFYPIQRSGLDVRQCS